MWKLSKTGQMVDADGIGISFSGYIGGQSSTVMAAYDAKKRETIHKVVMADDFHKALVSAVRGDLSLAVEVIAKYNKLREPYLPDTAL